MHVGQLIANLREACGWSQAELARRAPTGRTHLNALEQRAEPPTPKMLGKLLLALHAGGADFEVVETFVSAGYDRRTAVYTLDELINSQPPKPDPLKVMENALRDGGWERRIWKALVTLAAATRPRVDTAHDRA